MASRLDRETAAEQSTARRVDCFKEQYCRSNPVPEPVEGPDFQSIWPFDRLRNQIRFALGYS